MWGMSYVLHVCLVTLNTSDHLGPHAYCTHTHTHTPPSHPHPSHAQTTNWCWVPVLREGWHWDDVMGGFNQWSHSETWDTLAHMHREPTHTCASTLLSWYHTPQSCKHTHTHTHTHTDRHTHCEYTHMHRHTHTPHTSSTSNGKICNCIITLSFLFPFIFLYLFLMATLQKEAHQVSNAWT